MHSMLQDTVAVILGGGGSIGVVITRDFVNEGAKVAVLDHDQLSLWQLVEDITNKGGVASAFIVNAISKSEITEAAYLVKEKYGKIDIWINAANIYNSSPLLRTKENTWNNVSDINLKATIYGCQVAISHMEGSGKGSIINITSNSYKDQKRLGAVFSTSKSDIQGLTESIAQEFSNTRIRVNSICLPFAKEQNKYNRFIKKSNTSVFSTNCSQKYISLQDISDAAVLLASDFSRFITGHSIKFNNREDEDRD